MEKNAGNKKDSSLFSDESMPNPHTKDAAIIKLREGRYCERTLRPGGVSFTYNNPAARISLQSKLATMTKTDMSKHVGFCHGGRYKTRTCDLPHVKRMRYQLRQSSISLDRIHPFAAFVKPFLAGKRRIFFIDPSTSASPARSHDRAGDGTSPPSAASREIDRGRQTDCHTSDIGHWCAMTGGREQTSDARPCGEAGNDSLRHPPRDAKLVLQGGRAADATSLGEGGKGDGRIAAPVTSVTGSQ